MVKLLLTTLLILTCGITSAEITINKPLMKLVDSNGNVVSTSSTSIEKAMEKASALPNGLYYLQRPDVTIKVVNELEPCDCPVNPQPPTEPAYYEATASWTPPIENTDNTPLTDLAGYKIYYGTSADNLDSNIDVGNVTQYVITGLTANTYYFAVTAYSITGIESDLSNVVTFTES